MRFQGRWQVPRCPPGGAASSWLILPRQDGASHPRHQHQPSTIGTFVSSGYIRLTRQDVIELLLPRQLRGAGPPAGGTFHFQILVMPPLAKTCPKAVSVAGGVSLSVKAVRKKIFWCGSAFRWWHLRPSPRAWQTGHPAAGVRPEARWQHSRKLASDRTCPREGAMAALAKELAARTLDSRAHGRSLQPPIPARR